MTKTNLHTQPNSEDPARKDAVVASAPKKKEPSRAAFIISWLFVAAMLVMIFLVSARSSDDLDSNSGIISMVIDLLSAAATSLFGHKVDVSPVGHFSEYFVLGLALANALRLSMPLPRAGAYAVLFASLYGITDELHQIFVPGRSCDPMDWLVDTIAALLAVLIFTAVVRARRKRNK